MNLFLISDDINAVLFCLRLIIYKNELGNKLVFNPIYKYHSYLSYESNNDASNSLDNISFSLPPPQYFKIMSKKIIKIFTPFLFKTLVILNDLVYSLPLTTPKSYLKNTIVRGDIMQ